MVKWTELPRGRLCAAGCMLGMHGAAAEHCGVGAGTVKAAEFEALRGQVEQQVGCREQFPRDGGGKWVILRVIEGRGRVEAGYGGEVAARSVVGNAGCGLRGAVGPFLCWSLCKAQPDGAFS